MTLEQLKELYKNSRNSYEKAMYAKMIREYEEPVNLLRGTSEMIIKDNKPTII